jgi:DNA-binding NtrC family response regulator
VTQQRLAAPGMNLAGKKVLVVEDRYVIARDICRAVRDLGGEAVGPVGNLAMAQSAIGRAHVDLALVDLNLHDEIATPLIRQLTDRGIPFILATGYEDWVLPRELRGAPRVEKPVSVHVLRQAVERLGQ